MKKYKATVRQELETTVEFTEEDIEEGDSPEEAAIEFAMSQPQHFWDDIWSPDVDLEEIDD